MTLFLSYLERNYFRDYFFFSIKMQKALINAAFKEPPDDFFDELLERWSVVETNFAGNLSILLSQKILCCLERCCCFVVKTFEHNLNVSCWNQLDPENFLRVNVGLAKIFWLTSSIFSSLTDAQAIPWITDSLKRCVGNFKTRSTPFNFYATNGAKRLIKYTLRNVN